MSSRESSFDVRDQLEGHIQENRGRLLAQLGSWGIVKDRREDLLHDAVIRAMGALSQLENSAQLAGWFHQILRNQAMDHHRSVNRKNTGQQRWAGEVEKVFVPEFQPNYCQCVHDVLPELKSEYAQAIRSVDINDDELRDVATRLGITYNNLKVRLHRARKKLRQKLMITCEKCAEAGCIDCTCGK